MYKGLARQERANEEGSCTVGTVDSKRTRKVKDFPVKRLSPVRNGSALLCDRG